MSPGSTRLLLAAGLLLLAAPLLSAGAAVVPLPPELGQPVAPGACPDLCPDMLVDANAMNPYLSTINYGITDCAVREGMAPPGPQRIVRFTTFIPNDGPGDLFVGSPSSHPENFYYSDCHRHYHTKDYADYRVWQPADYDAYKALRLTHPFHPADQLLAMLAPDQQPVGGHKAGFCVLDLSRSNTPLGRVLGLVNGPKYGCGNMGISAGWADIYSSGIQGQWVVITGVAPGDYLVEIEVNAHHHFQELNYWNNSVTRAITIT